MPTKPSHAAASMRRGQLRRTDKVMSAQEVDDFLARAFCGRIATVDAQGYPYIHPTLYVWMGRTVYMHTSRHEGHFIDNVRHSDRVSFEADEPGQIFPYGHVECDTSVSYRSVIMFGRIRISEVEEEQRRFYAAFMAKYAPPDSWGRDKGSFPRIASTIVYAVTPELVTGKQGTLPAIADQWPNRNLTASPGWTKGK